MLVLRDVTIAAGGGEPVIACADVAVDDDGVLVEVAPTGGSATATLVPGAVDLHLDNLVSPGRG